MKLYQLARVLTDNTNIYAFTMDRDGGVNGEFGGKASAFRDPENDWEIYDAEPDDDGIVVNVLSHQA